MQIYATEYATLLFNDLHGTIHYLASNGGCISPSVYDTAQRLRLLPPTSPEPIIAWLLDQQQPNGSWGTIATEIGRYVPTLAAILALNKYADQPSVACAMQHAIAFLQTHHSTIDLPHDAPVGIELILPYLLNECNDAGITISFAPFHSVIECGKQRLNIIQQSGSRIPPTAIHSWEAWGSIPDPRLVSASGGVGHSPAATARWLQLAYQSEHQPDLQLAISNAEQYLNHASEATMSVIADLLPTVWPINRFEQSFGLYMLTINGLLNHPLLCATIQDQIDNLADALTPQGLGMSDSFLADGDDTAAAAFVLTQAHKPVDVKAHLNPFIHPSGTHFVAYQGELQASLSLTARAVHILRMVNEDISAYYPFLLNQQTPDGRWLGDKWNSSWFYVTYHAVLALIGSVHEHVLETTYQILRQHQRPDGGWSSSHYSTMNDTAYAVLTLLLFEHKKTDPSYNHTIRRGLDWMTHHYIPLTTNNETPWIGKDGYYLYRVDRIVQICAMLSMMRFLENQHE